jgi:hypothetical protein
VANWLPFHWAGYDASLHYTYRINDLGDIDYVYSEFAHNVRHHIRKASGELAVRTDLGLEELLELNRRSCQAKGVQPSFSDEFAYRLDGACVEHDARTIFAAVDSSGRVHAASYVVADSRRSYLLFSAADPELRSSHGQTLVVWEAIRDAARESHAFDFLGSMVESVERRNRSFGARRTPYVFVSRERPIARALRGARNVTTALGRRGRRTKSGDVDSSESSQ